MALAQTISTDTIGGTTYDWQANGGPYRMIYNDDALGIHAVWMFSADQTAGWADRNMRYNFYDKVSSTWLFNQGGNFMDWGSNVFSAKTGYGSLDVNPLTGCAYVGGHQGNIYLNCAKDAAPGSGTFEECTGSGGAGEGYLWPPIGLDATGKVHIACIDNATRGAVYYTRIDPWCTYATPVQVSVTNPIFSDEQIAVSRRSNKIIIDWIYTEASVNPPDPLFYRVSEDGGATWGSEVQLDYPPAFSPGSDTLPSFHLSGGSLMWDNNDNFHITTNVMPVIEATGYIIPAEIWDYCPASTPQWRKITRAVCKDSNLMAGVGYNTMYAARPQLSQDEAGNYYCIWEQFDSSNVESATSVLRADIFGAASRDGGVTWSDAVKLTASDATSHRFPSVAQLAGTNLHVVYEQDLQAGMFVQAEGNVTLNPIVYMEVPVDIFQGGVSENPLQSHTTVPKLAVSPNPFRTSATIDYSLSRAGSAALRVYDASGHLVKTLIDGNLPAGTGNAIWNGTSQTGEAVSRGIYFARLETPNQTISQKVVFSR